MTNTAIFLFIAALTTPVGPTFHIDSLFPNDYGDDDAGYAGGCFIGLHRADTSSDDYIFVDNYLQQGDIRIDGHYIKLALTKDSSDPAHIRRDFRSADGATEAKTDLDRHEEKVTDGPSLETVNGSLIVTHHNRVQTLSVKGRGSC